MNKRYHKIKLIPIVAILLLFLIPLISSPVAAAVTFNAGSGTSTNTNPPGACTIVIVMTGATTLGPGTTTPLTVIFSYTFTDSNAGPSGSNHRCTMRVSEPTSGTNAVVSTGWVWVAPGTSVPGTLTNGPIGFVNPPPTLTFTIGVTMDVLDLNAPPRGLTLGPITTTLILT